MKLLGRLIISADFSAVILKVTEVMQMIILQKEYNTGNYWNIEVNYCYLISNENMRSRREYKEKK